MLPGPRFLFVFGATLVGAIVLLLLFYLLIRLLRQQAPGKNERTPAERATSEVVFVSSTLQTVIKELKAKERELTESLRTAEQQTEEQAQIIASLGDMVRHVFFAINGEGLLTFWNPLLRSSLKVDVWSRRHYLDVFGADSALATLLQGCLENGQAWDSERVEYTMPSGEVKTLFVSARPWRARRGNNSGIVCLLTEVDQPTR